MHECRTAVAALICFLGIAFTSEFAAAGNVDLAQKVRTIALKAVIDPQGIQALREVPLELAFAPLQEIVRDGSAMTEQRMRARKIDQEQQWTDAEKASGHLPPEAVEKAGGIAREVLMQHPELEKFLTTKLAALKQVFEQYETRPTSPELTAAAAEYGFVLDLVEGLQPEVSLRLLGPALFTPSYPARQNGDRLEESPATLALALVRKAAKSGYNEEVPADIELARIWWKQVASLLALKNEKVQMSAADAEHDPESVRELRAFPLDESFDALRRLAWDTKVRSGRISPGAQRAGEIAFQVLLDHPDLESFLAARMNTLKETLEKPASGVRGRYLTYDPAEYRYLIGFAEMLPPEMAIRLLGPALFSPYFPTREYSDYSEHSPASYALSSFRRVGLHLGEPVPDSLDLARAWWNKNANRFEVKSKEEPPEEASPTTSLTSAEITNGVAAPPLITALPAVTTPSDSIPANRPHYHYSWILAAAIAFLFFAATCSWFCARKPR